MNADDFAHRLLALEVQADEHTAEIRRLSARLHALHHRINTTQRKHHR